MRDHEADPAPDGDREHQDDGREPGDDREHQDDDREPGDEPEHRDDRGLSDRDRAVLALERRAWPGPGAKERAVREELGMSPTRYYQLLNALLDDPRALAYDPVTVNRLRRLRDTRRGRR